MSRRKQIEAWAVVVDSADLPVRELKFERRVAEAIASSDYSMSGGRVVHLTEHDPALHTLAREAVKWLDARYHPKLIGHIIERYKNNRANGKRRRR